MKSKEEPTDLDRSTGRLVDSEDYRSRASGFGTTKQGQGLAREYREQIAARITADRTNGRRDKNVWRALKGMDDAALALRLLVAGISVAEDGDLGTDEDGEKNPREQMRFIGRNLGQQGLAGLKAGAWGITMLCALPVFALDGDILKMTAAADEIMDGVLARAVAANCRHSRNHPHLGQMSARAACPQIISHHRSRLFARTMHQLRMPCARQLEPDGCGGFSMPSMRCKPCRSPSMSRCAIL
jgi:hypothetical protein